MRKSEEHTRSPLFSCSLWAFLCVGYIETYPRGLIAPLRPLRGLYEPFSSGRIDAEP